MKRFNRYVKDFCIGGLVHDHEVAGSYSRMAGDLEKDAELRMDISERRSTDLRPNAAQVEEIFFARVFLDLIAQDQDVDTGENGTVSHGGAPRDIGVDQVNGPYTAARPEEEA
jgi:hypothetical protein